MNKDKTLTTDDIGKMTDEEIKKLLLFKSSYKTSCGPKCTCMISSLTRFQGMLPDELCGVEIADNSLPQEPFETEVDSLCGCQESHTYKLTGDEKGLHYERTESHLMDSGRLRLPNFRD